MKGIGFLYSRQWQDEKLLDLKSGFKHENKQVWKERCVWKLFLQSKYVKIYAGRRQVEAGWSSRAWT